MKHIYHIIVILSFLIPIISYAQTSEYKVIGYIVSNKEYTLSVTLNTIEIKDKQNKIIDVKKAYVRAISTDSSLYMAFHDVDFEHDKKRVKSICNFFFNRNGIIEIYFNKEKITLLTIKNNGRIHN